MKWVPCGPILRLRLNRGWAISAYRKLVLMTTEITDIQGALKEFKSLWTFSFAQVPGVNTSLLQMKWTEEGRKMQEVTEQIIQRPKASSGFSAPCSQPVIYLGDVLGC